MGYLADHYAIKDTTPVATDAYHATTAYGYWLEGRHNNPSVSYMFARKEACGGGYTVSAGLEGVIDMLQRWQEHGFSESDIAWLKSQHVPSGKPNVPPRRKYPDAFIDELKSWKWHLKVDAIPEGSLVFPQEAVLRIAGPLAQVKWFESVALGIMNGQEAYATHGARMADVVRREMENGAQQGAASVQGMRRGPAFGAMVESSRGLGVGGYTSTSTGTAAKALGQVWAGTMDHAWVMTHRQELGNVPLKELFRLRDEGRTAELQEALAGDAFRSFVFAHPEGGILLLDTYDPKRGLENAITVFQEMCELYAERPELNLNAVGYGVRFDSGDLTAYSKLALRRFAETGFVQGLNAEQVQGMSDAQLLPWGDKCKHFCAAADGIDEYAAQEMRQKGAWYKSWGVGTAGSHVPPAGNVYKAASVCLDVLHSPDQPVVMTPVSKVVSSAPVKSSNPGIINSRRFYDETGKLSHIVIYDESLGLDAQQRIINMRDFSDAKVNPSAPSSGTDALVPVFDASGSYVFNEPAKKESFPGSGHFVTDLGALSKKVQQALDTLPDAVRRVARPADDLLKSLLLKAYKQAEQAGTSTLELDIAAIKAQLPPEVAHVPIYLDRNLYEQRRVVEARHQIQGAGGVGEYLERFAGGAPAEAPPSPSISGALTATAAEPNRGKA